MTTHRAFRHWIFAVLAFTGCGRSHEDIGSETHFLTTCVDDAQCGPLSCHAGACTMSCEDDGPCSMLSPLAACIADSASGTCQVACTAASQCTMLGTELGCTEGVCSPPPAEVPSSAPVVLGCDLETEFPDDELCLPAPAPEDGIQLHLGPSRYDDSDALRPFVLNPGEEVEDCWSFEAPNTADIAYAQWESSARMGQNRALIQIYAPDPDANDVDLCDETARAEYPELIGELPILQRPRIPRAELPPENTAVAFRMPAGARIRVRLHSYNFNEVPLLRELWVNLYFSAVEPVQYAGMLQVAGGTEWSIEPSSELTAEFECPIAHSGRLLGLRPSILQSTHNLDVRLRRADGEVVTLLSQLDSTPETYLFDSVTQNLFEGVGGEPGWSAHSGPVLIEPGDTLQWTCLVVNEGPQTLVHMEDHARGAMCDLIGATIGGDIRCALP